MRAILDTNVLVRFLVSSRQDAGQCTAARETFQSAEEIIIPTPVFCELVWVLRSVYKLDTEKISTLIADVLDAEKIRVNEDEVLAGLAMLKQGGDFADGVVAYTGRALSRDAVFVSFDKQAVRLLGEQGIAAICIQQPIGYTSPP